MSDSTSAPTSTARRLTDPDLVGLYPPIEPYDTGMLPVGDGHTLYYEQSGNPDGKPAVFLHGGPGGGVGPKHRRLFDPAKYRIVLVDQRMAGRSTPHASEPRADLSTNTTWHLVDDLEVLREHLGIQRWQVFGGSWGSCLALAYAQTHPDRVTELVLRGLFTLRQSELAWTYEGPARNIFPDDWEAFIAPVPAEQRTPGGIQQAYHRLLFDADPAVHVPAGRTWSQWEARLITLYRDDDLIAKFGEDAQAVAFARIENHFFVNHGWLREGQLIEDAHLVADIPTVLVQGRYDMCTPMVTAYDLAKALPSAELIVTPDAGHAFDEPSTLDALIRTTDRFADEAARDE